MRKLTISPEITDGIGVPVELDDTQIKECLKKINEIGFGLATIKERIEKKTLDVNMRECILGVIEHHIANLSNIVGFDSLSQGKLDEKHKEIRECNQRIAELEKQLGSNKPIDGFQEQVRHLSNIVEDWWSTKSLGFIFSEGLSYTQYGYMILKFTLQAGKSSHRKEDKTISELKSEGWDILQEKGEDSQLLDTQNNKDKLFSMITERFPSILIHDFKVTKSYGGIFYIREVEAIVYDIKDIVNGQERNDTDE